MQGPPHRSPQHLHQRPRGHQHAPLRPQPAAATQPAQPTKAYNPRHPERTLLYRTIAEHFETSLELASVGQFDGQGDHHTPPAYVEKAFRKYLECGIFAHGFARVRCDDCGDDFLVAFFCKGRGNWGQTSINSDILRSVVTSRIETGSEIHPIRG